MNRESEAEFREFAELTYGPLLRAGYLLCGDHGRAEDLVQVTLAKIAFAWPRLRSAPSLHNYAHKALVRGYISAARLRWWREKPTEFTAELPTPGDMHEVEQRDALRRALRLLPPRQRTAVVLRFYLDLSESQAAEVLGCTTGTVKSLTSRGLSRLRERLTATPSELLTRGTR